MSNRTALDGLGLLIANLVGGCILSVIVLQGISLSTTGAGNFGIGIIVMMLFPIMIIAFPLLLWILQSIFIWIHYSRKNREIITVGFLGSCFVLSAPFVLGFWLQNAFPWYWSLIISLLMAIGSLALVGIRMQLWAEQAMMEKSQREDEYWHRRR